MASPSRRRRQPGPEQPPLHPFDEMQQQQMQHPDPGLMAHLMRQRHWQRHQEDHPFPPPPPPMPSSPSRGRAAASGGARGGGAPPLLLRLRDGAKNGAAPSPVALLVDDQCALSRFWSDWRAAEHRFLSGASSSSTAGMGAAGHGCIGGATTATAAGGASRPGARQRQQQHRPPADTHEAYEEEEEEEEEGIEEDLEALLREPPAPPRARPPSPLSASAGAGGAKLPDGTEGDAKQPAGRDAGGAEGDGGATATTGKGKGKGEASASASEAEAAMLAARVAELEARLVETEALLGSDPGTVILALERELAQAKLALAYTEAEKDELEVQLCNLQQQRGQQLKQGRQAGTTGSSRETTMQILIKTLTGRKQSFNFEPEEKVEAVKQALQEKEGIQVDQIRLIYAGKQLADDKTLAFYGVVAGGTIHMVLQLRGGQ